MYVLNAIKYYLLRPTVCLRYVHDGTGISLGSHSFKNVHSRFYFYHKNTIF